MISTVSAMSYKSEDTVAPKTFDPTPAALRSAVRRNSQMNRQLSRVRKSLTVEEKEAQQIISKGECKLVAKLKQFKIRSQSAERSMKSIKEIKEVNVPGETENGSTTEVLDSRSKIQRKKFYRDCSRATLVIPDAEPESENKPSEIVLQPSPEVSKYYMPSWQRADLIKKQKEEEDKNSKIYGKKRR